MINISTLFDPKYVFLIYAPILFALNKRVGHRMLIALTLTEWANQVLKWLLAGERPYWYVHERATELAAESNRTSQMLAESATGIDSYDMAAILADYNRQPAVPQLRQFPVTCELGAGSPSGHAMVTATVWYILIDAYLKGELPVFSRVDYQQTPSSSIRAILAKISWSIYTLILVMISLSRVYLACHFPHQCLCGAVLGVIVARLVIDKLPMERLHRGHFVATTALMFASAMATYAGLRSVGVDPLWSVDKGMRWCVKKEYIHMDTTPFFSMMRYLGFCLGAGLAYDSAKMFENNKESEVDQGQSLFLRRALVSGASIAFGQMLLSLPLPRENLQLFYLISFLMYTTFAYAIARPIPTLVKQSWTGSRCCDSNKIN